MYIIGAVATTILGSWFFYNIIDSALEPDYIASLIRGSFILYAILYKLP